MAAYIYIIASNKDGPVKIGRSNNPDRRLKQLQTGQDKTLYIFHKELVADDEINQMERAIHKTIGYKRAKGEWFHVSVDEAIDEIRYAKILYEDNLRDETAAEYKKRLT